MSEDLKKRIPDVFRRNPKGTRRSSTSRTSRNGFPGGSPCHSGRGQGTPGRGRPEVLVQRQHDVCHAGRVLPEGRTTELLNQVMDWTVLPPSGDGRPPGRSGKDDPFRGPGGGVAEAGREVVPFKKGPDYIDAAWLSLAAGRPCHNLDTFLMGTEQVSALFHAMPWKETFPSSRETGGSTTASTPRESPARRNWPSFSRRPWFWLSTATRSRGRPRPWSSAASISTPGWISGA